MLEQRSLQKTEQVFEQMEDFVQQLANIEKAHIKDDVAITKFMYWLKTNVGKTRTTEDLNRDEKLYLNSYHKLVHTKLAQYLSNEDQGWMKSYTREV